MSASTMTIFICAIVLSRHEDLLRAIGDKAVNYWAQGGAELAWTVAKVGSDTFVIVVDRSPALLREHVHAAQESMAPVLRIASATPEIAKGAIALLKTSRTLIHLACKGKEPYADGFLATMIWISLCEVYRWVKLIVRFWLLILVVLCLVEMLA